MSNIAERSNIFYLAIFDIDLISFFQRYDEF